MTCTRWIMLSVIALTSAPAAAAMLDLRAMSCQQFLAQPLDGLAITMAFLDGYYRTEDDPLVITEAATAVMAKQLAEHCVANPNDGLIAATDKLFKKD